MSQERRASMLMRSQLALDCRSRLAHTAAVAMWGPLARCLHLQNVDNKQTVKLNCMEGRKRGCKKSGLDEITWRWQWMNPTAAPAQLFLCAWLRFKPPLCPHKLLLKPSSSASPNCKQRIDSLRSISKSGLLRGWLYLREAEGIRCTAVKLMSHFMDSLCAG